MPNPVTKIVVFDLDETIGHFFLVRLIWESMHHFIEYNHIAYKLTQNDFNELIDMYPETLRPDIISVLTYLRRKRQLGACGGIMIYTNNRYPKEWVDMITSYIENRVGGRVFDRTVLAFKLRGKVQELMRTTAEKKLSDFVACCRLPTDIEICYIDDTEYLGMSSDNVFYLKLRPYYYYYTKDVVVNRMMMGSLVNHILMIENIHIDLVMRNKELFATYMANFLEAHRIIYRQKEVLDYEMDKIVTKRIKSHLEVFFNNAAFSRLK